MKANEAWLIEAVRGWLQEDIGPGDVSAMTTIPEDLQGRAIIHAKSAGVFAGMEVLTAVFREVDAEVTVLPRVADGDLLEKGTVIAEVEGTVRSILSGERVALNIVQRLSGIATKTRKVVEEASKGRAAVRVVDTRKTTPGLRVFEKYAVRVGGGHNHRFGLFDAVMIKDNHIKAAGSISRAVEQARAGIPHTMKIEVETESLAQVEEALQAGADIIMFDNMTPETMKQAVAMVSGRAVTEASGGIAMANIAEIAATGVDVISMGSLTYFVEALDISLDLYAKKQSER